MEKEDFSQRASFSINIIVSSWNLYIHKKVLIDKI